MKLPLLAASISSHCRSSMTSQKSCEMGIRSKSATPDVAKRKSRMCSLEICQSRKNQRSLPQNQTSLVFSLTQKALSQLSRFRTSNLAVCNRFLILQRVLLLIKRFACSNCKSKRCVARFDCLSNKAAPLPRHLH